MEPVLLGAVKVLLLLQAAQASVVGTVRDRESGEPIAGAVVALIDLGRATGTDAAGRYALPLVPAGPHQLTIRSIGHAPRSVRALVPGAGELEIHVSLPAVPIRLETIEVRGPRDAGGAGGPFPDRGISLAAVRNHPLLAEPDVFQALGGGDVVLQPESPRGVHVRGGASDHTAYTLDGIPVFSPYHAAGLFSAWNPDALSRLDLSSAAPSPADPDALSGTVAGITRAPGPHLNAQGSVSTTQGRFTLDGPLGAAGAGYLVSVRSSFPGAVAPRDEASYLRGGTGDRLAKIEAPAFGGRVRLLGYSNENELDAAARSPENQASPDPRRNVFEWQSRSVGAEWQREFAGVALRVMGWSATGDASSAWAARTAGVAMTAARRDEGLLAAVARRTDRATSVMGIRVERSRTSYGIESDATGGPSWTLAARTPVAALFARHATTIGHRMDLDAGASLAAAGGGLHLGPRAQLRWQPSERLTVSGSFARVYQFAQSLRNAESVVGNVFPVDLYIGAGAPGVPVARSDQGVIAADYRAMPGVRVGLQAYARTFDGLLLVAPQTGEPFATSGFAVGAGAARGVSFDAAVVTGRYGLVASYALQHVRRTDGASSYVPDLGATHLLQGGVVVFPAASASIRLGATAALQRRTTTLSGDLDWEACNLRDQGCEFGGSPYYSGEPLGATALPPYLRVDLSVRKHWHLEVAGRHAVIALFGTVTNVLSRKNVLTYVRDPATAGLLEIEMRPPSPLVVGLDWRF